MSILHKNTEQIKFIPINLSFFDKNLLNFYLKSVNNTIINQRVICNFIKSIAYDARQIKPPHCGHII